MSPSNSAEGRRRGIAVNHLTLQVPRGGVYGLLGPNGAGKTTTINMMIGLEKPTSGSIHILGLDVRDPRALRALRAHMGVVSQGTALHNELTALENLTYYGGLFGMAGRSKRDRIQHVLQVVQLEDVQHNRVSTFSGGMKRRLAIARALVPDPKILILDEPTTGIDVQNRHGIWRHIEALGEQGKTILLTTNTLDEAQELCQRLAIIDHGKLIVEDSLSNLTAQYGDGTMEVETTEVTRMAPTLRALPGVVAVQQDGVLLRVIARGMNGSTERPGGFYPGPREWCRPVPGEEAHA